MCDITPILKDLFKTVYRPHFDDAISSKDFVIRLLKESENTSLTSLNTILDLELRRDQSPLYYIDQSIKFICTTHIYQIAVINYLIDKLPEFAPIFFKKWQQRLEELQKEYRSAFNSKHINTSDEKEKPIDSSVQTEIDPAENISRSGSSQTDVKSHNPNNQDDASQEVSSDPHSNSQDNITQQDYLFQNQYHIVPSIFYIVDGNTQFDIQKKIYDLIPDNHVFVKFTHTNNLIYFEYMKKDNLINIENTKRNLRKNDILSRVLWDYITTIERMHQTIFLFLHTEFESMEAVRGALIRLRDNRINVIAIPLSEQGDKAIRKFQQRKLLEIDTAHPLYLCIDT